MTLEERFNQLVQLNVQNFKTLANEVSALKKRVVELEQQLTQVGGQPAVEPVAEKEMYVNPKNGLPITVAPTREMQEAIFYSGGDED